MSVVFSRNKKKRPRSPSNDSFVKTVTSKVSSLLPNTITKWFSRSGTSSANGSLPTADGTDSSTEDESQDIPVTTLPPAKRARLSSSPIYSHYESSQIISQSTVSVQTDTCMPYNPVQPPSTRNVYWQEPNYISTPIGTPNGDDITERSDGSSASSEHIINSINQVIPSKRKSLYDSLSMRTMHHEKNALKDSCNMRENYITPIRSTCENATIERSDRESTLFTSEHPINSENQSVVTKSINHEKNTAKRVCNRRDTNYTSTPYRPINEDATIEISDRDSTLPKTEHTINRVNQTVATKRKSLFDSLSMNAAKRACVKTSSNALRDLNRPYFKPSLLACSPFYPGPTMYGGAGISNTNNFNIKQNVTLVNNPSTSDNSGMSHMSHAARRIFDLLEPYPSPLMEAKRIPQYTKPKSQENFVSGTSHNSKVVSYKTQELHAPNYASTLQIKRKLRLMDSTIAARQLIASHSSTSDENIVSRSSTSKEKIESPTNKTEEYLPITTYNQFNKETPIAKEYDSMEATNKMKLKLTKQNTADDISTPVSLPAVLQNDQDKMLTSTSISPSIFKSANPTPALSPTTKVATVDKNVSAVTTTTSGSDPLNTVFEFSHPVKTTFGTEMKNIASPMFKFGSPENSVNKPEFTGHKSKDSCKISAFKEITSSDNKKLDTKQWKCPDCWVSNNASLEKCVCCGYKKCNIDANKPVKCIKCKIADSQGNGLNCINCEKSQSQSSNQPIATKSKWKCKECWVPNIETDDNCVCCGVPNSEKTTGTLLVPKVVSESKWKCDECWIMNNAELEKCAACNSIKPSTKQSGSGMTATTSSPFVKAADNIFQNIVKSQTDNWQCTICLISNDSGKSKCMCCESEKEGAKKNDEGKSYNFASVPNIEFKFGIDPKVQETNLAKAAEAKSTADPSLDISETNNNIPNKIPSFTFTLPCKKLSNEVNTSTKNVTEPPKLNLTFGIPNQSFTGPALATASSADKSLETIAKVIDDDKGKPQEVSKVDFSFSPGFNENNSVPGLVSNPSITSFVTKDKPSEVSSVDSTKNVSDNPLLLPTTAISAPITQPLFTFSSEIKPVSSTVRKPSFSPKIKPAFSTDIKPSFSAEIKQTFSPSIEPAFTTEVKPAFSTEMKPAFPTEMKTTFSTVGKPTFFGYPPSTETVNSSFSSQLQTVPVTTAPTLSLIQSTQSSDTNVNSNVSLFSKTEFKKPDNTTSAAPQPFAASGLIFSFGNSSQSAAPQPEKPKFNFVLGSEKSESQNLFKNTFGGTAGNAAVPNKFGIATGNTPTAPTGGSNGLSGNTLTGGNVLPANNPFGATEMTTKSLSSGNSLQTSNLTTTPPTALFAPAVQKENAWSMNNNAVPNVFEPKPTSFTFGSTPFNANNPTPTFGSTTQSSQNIFGITNANNGLPSLFSSPANQTVSNVFGSSIQPVANPTPALGMFGTPSAAATPTFGSSNPSLPSFEAPSLTPAQAPSFNFGAPQSTSVFGFGQQPQQLPAQTGVYNFGASAGGGAVGGGQVHFSMGSAPAAPLRRVLRKAVRRTQQR